MPIEVKGGSVNNNLGSGTSIGKGVTLVSIGSTYSHNAGHGINAHPDANVTLIAPVIEFNGGDGIHSHDDISEIIKLLDLKSDINENDLRNLISNLISESPEKQKEILSSSFLSRTDSFLGITTKLLEVLSTFGSN